MGLVVEGVIGVKEAFRRDFIWDKLDSNFWLSLSEVTFGLESGNE